MKLYKFEDFVRESKGNKKDSSVIMPNNIDNLSKIKKLRNNPDFLIANIQPEPEAISDMEEIELNPFEFDVDVDDYNDL